MQVENRPSAVQTAPPVALLNEWDLAAASYLQARRRKRHLRAKRLWARKRRRMDRASRPRTIPITRRKGYYKSTTPRFEVPGMRPKSATKGGHISTRRPKRWPENIHQAEMLRDWGALRHLGAPKFGKTDYRDVEIPDGLLKTFDNGELVREWLTGWMTYICEFTNLYANDIADDNALARIDLEYVKRAATAIVCYISDNLPGVVCPYCADAPDGNDCRCYDLGWLPWKEVMDDGNEPAGQPLAAASECSSTPEAAADSGS